ncbi:Lrp/AsnC family transcriptional regulator [Aestuariirhabdus sp. Z084]|uniref:Lrp/AsnC family transcriptional regulator n=1 Tax=Aestuariirhabdus haliotis TaxID=2918751 RepID=UPI00201B4605|nr:Lrp/AsnC family transcriptional regulator [Aestuariirhabdus haliotis]MCL6414415.1 Lrp/AsnC family transcriptional regulator [Aestuariirhabdus haliotis]MCL6418347.1 Lrp/AsnC family transcriptional regulator [Aestuariirhabdus haliotis]
MLDSINSKILIALQENARISFAKLGERVHLSAPAVAERVRKMEAAGIITGYGVRVDLDKLGYPIVALVQCKVFGAKEKALKQLLLERDEVVECYNVTGEQAFIVKLAVKSLALLDEVLEEICAVSDTNTMVVLKEPVHRVLPGDFG